MRTLEDQEIVEAIERECEAIDRIARKLLRETEPSVERDRLCDLVRSLLRASRT